MVLPAGLGVAFGRFAAGNVVGVFFPPRFPGLPISVLVNCTGLRPPGRLQEIELFNTSGHVLLSLPAQPLLNSSGPSAQLWLGSPLWVPPGDFLLKVKGEDGQGHPLHRLSGVTYTSVVPGECSPRVLSRDQRLQCCLCCGFSLVILLPRVLYICTPPTPSRSAQSEHLQQYPGLQP